MSECDGPDRAADCDAAVADSADSADAADSVAADSADSVAADSADSVAADSADSVAADSANSVAADSADSVAADSADSVSADSADATAADSTAAADPAMHQEGYTNGVDDDGRSDDESGSDDEELSLEDAAAPARVLAALNALRKSRQHYDVVLVAGGAELAAHRAVLAAASPYLLRELADGAPLYRVDGVDAPALRALVDYLYTGRLALRGAAAARALYRAAWRLRAERPRAHAAACLLRRPAPAQALAARALPDLDPATAAALDRYIADNFEEVCESGALAALPDVRIEVMRHSSAAGGEEAAGVVAAAALAWLRAHAAPDDLAARAHLVYVDEAGALRDCGELPERRGDAPELQQYRREQARRRRAPPAPPAPPAPLPGRPLGQRAARDHSAVVAARRAPGGSVRALLVLRGRLLGARLLWSDVARGGGGRGGALGGDAPGERAPLAALAAPRAALGVAAVGGRLLACGGYDRTRVLRSAEAYDPATNAWSAAAEMRGPRARFPAARLGAEVWALGGSDGLQELATAEAWSAAGGWRARPALPLALSHAAAAADEARGLLYVVGGWAGGATLKRVLVFAAAAGAWAEAPALGAARAQAAAAWWEGALWALGGCDAWRCLAGTERLAAGAARWEAGPALPTARRSVGACAWRGRLVAAGGSDGAASLRRVEWLAPGEAAWRPLAPLRRARAAAGLAVLAPALYAVAGFDGKEFLSCVESLADPADQWTALSAAPAPAAPPAQPDETTESATP